MKLHLRRNPVILVLLCTFLSTLCWGQTSPVNTLLSRYQIDKEAYCVGEIGSFSYTAATDLKPGTSLQFYQSSTAQTYQPRQLLTSTTATSGVVSFTATALLPQYPYAYLLVESSERIGEFQRISAIDVQKPLSLSLLPLNKVVYENEPLQMLPIYDAWAERPFTYTVAVPGSVSVLNGQTLYELGTYKSGTYTLLGATNACGPGKASGSMSVTVIPKSTVRIEATTWNVPCAGQDFNDIYLSTSGKFESTNVFTAYLSDLNGNNLRALPTFLDNDNNNKLTIKVPDDISVQKEYVLRIGSSNPYHLGTSVSSEVGGLSHSQGYLERVLLNFRVRPAPSATLTGTTSITRGDSTRLNVVLTGTPPWQFTVLSNTSRAFELETSQNSFVLPVRPDSTTTYQLADLFDAVCGRGSVSSTALVTVSKLLATEPTLPLEIRTWPNPTTGLLQLEGQFIKPNPVQINLITTLGTLVQSHTTQPIEGWIRHSLDIGRLTAGVYILTVRQGNEHAQFKVVKQ